MKNHGINPFDAKEKPFNFNGVKFYNDGAIFDPQTKDFVDIYCFDVLKSGMPPVSLYVGGYEFVSPNGVKETKKGIVVYGVSSSSEKIYESLSLLEKKGIIQKQGLKKAMQ